MAISLIQDSEMRGFLRLAAVLLAIAAGGTPTASAQAQQPTGVMFEDVRVFDGISGRLTEPSNLLVVGKIIEADPGPRSRRVRA